MHKTAVFDERTGKLNQGPFIFKVDAGPGRIFLQKGFWRIEQHYSSVVSSL
jgi:hypothetical protein